MAEIPLDLRLASLEARLRAQEIVVQCLCKVIATLDPRSSHSVAVALEGGRARAGRDHRRG